LLLLVPAWGQYPFLSGGYVENCHCESWVKYSFL